MIIRLPRCLPALLPLLLLAACGEEAEVPVEDDGRSASGEVLEGSISDDMLPMEHVRSQAPRAEAENDAEGGEEAASEADE